MAADLTPALEHTGRYRVGDPEGDHEKHHGREGEDRGKGAPDLSRETSRSAPRR